MQKRWNILKADEKKVIALQQLLKIHPVICRILVQRSIETFDDARNFFRPDLSRRPEMPSVSAAAMARSAREARLDPQHPTLIWRDVNYAEGA